MGQAGKSDRDQRGEENHRPKVTEVAHCSATPPADDLQCINNRNQVYHAGRSDESRPKVARGARHIRAALLQQMRSKIENPRRRISDKTESSKRAARMNGKNETTHGKPRERQPSDGNEKHRAPAPPPDQGMSQPGHSPA